MKEGLPGNKTDLDGVSPTVVLGTNLLESPKVSHIDLNQLETSDSVTMRSANQAKYLNSLKEHGFRFKEFINHDLICQKDSPEELVSVYLATSFLSDIDLSIEISSANSATSSLFRKTRLNSDEETTSNQV